MRLPSVLDLLDAVNRVSRAHPAVRTWWLTPRARLPLRGESTYGSTERVIDLALESAEGAAPDHARIEIELSALLPRSAVTVRPFQPEERSRLMRLLSTEQATPHDTTSALPATRDGQ